MQRINYPPLKLKKGDVFACLVATFRPKQAKTGWDVGDEIAPIPISTKYIKRRSNKTKNILI
jgi:hypothetical protein